MGTYAYFSLGTPDGLEGFFWASGPQSFLDWARKVEESYPETITPAGLLRLERIVAEGPSGLVPADRRDADLVDAIFEHYLLTYCDSTPERSPRSAANGGRKIGAYYEARPKIEALCSGRTSLCWSYILEGRAVGRPADLYPYRSSDEVCSFGFWTAEEARFVHDDLSAKFPAVASRGRERASGEPVEPLYYEDAIYIAIEATARATAENTGLILKVV